jgi:hypothetical protein
MGPQATLIGRSVYIFGGEDASRRPLGDLHILDLAAMAWVRPDTAGIPPAPRSAHTAVAYKVRPLQATLAVAWPSLRLATSCSFAC